MARMWFPAQKATPPSPGRRTKKGRNPSPRYLRPKNQSSEWLAFGFCSLYLAAGRLWKTLDSLSKRAMLVSVGKSS